MLRPGPSVALLGSLSSRRACTGGAWPAGMGKLNLGSDKTGASPPLTGFSVGGEWKMPGPGSFIFVAFSFVP